ncbi:hypothetical protein PMIN06_003070 [Paraphaeosphaeria minitans]
MQSSTLRNVRAYWLRAKAEWVGCAFGGRRDSGKSRGRSLQPTTTNGHDPLHHHHNRMTPLTHGCYRRYEWPWTTDSAYLTASCRRLATLQSFVSSFRYLALLAWPVTSRYGRRKTLTLASAIFVVGAVVQTMHTHAMGALYLRRTHHRGHKPRRRDRRGPHVQLGDGTQTLARTDRFVFPAELPIPYEPRLPPLATRRASTTNLAAKTLTHMVDHGVLRGISGQSSMQWQIPIGLQEVVAKMEEIGIGVEVEARDTQGYQELVGSPNFKRIFTAFAVFAVFAAQQATWATAFAYFGPQYFKLSVGAGDRHLLLTSIFGAVNSVACASFGFFLSERVGRRQVLIWDALLMATCQISCAAIVKNVPAASNSNTKSSEIATVALIYLFAIAYNFS